MKTVEDIIVYSDCSALKTADRGVAFYMLFREFFTPGTMLFWTIERGLRLDCGLEEYNND